MKKMLLVVIGIVMGLVISLQAETIKIVGDNWSPYNMQPNSGNEGYVVDVVKAIFNQKGIEVKYELINWARAINDTRKGKYNAVLCAFKDDAPDFIFPVEEVGVSNTLFWVRTNDNWVYKGIESLKTRVFGAVIDYKYGEPIDSYINNTNNIGKVDLIGGDDPLRKNILKLVRNRIDVTIEDQAVMNYKLSKMHLTSKVKSAGSLGKFKIYVAFSPNNPNSKRYARIFSEGIKKLRASGKLKQILAKYNLTDWK